ncbi:hypothetical protein BD413DRAFT_684062 [Trametes elegans]|nr:hypothetical protein BD413DRAFT_684062 [Trametes elegans]
MPRHVEGSPAEKIWRRQSAGNCPGDRVPRICVSHWALAYHRHAGDCPPELSTAVHQSCPYVSLSTPYHHVPQPLSLNVVHVLLQYISPPSQLTHPVPPHLLSKPLLQRHHFLRLSPEEPDEYLCWPSSPDRKARVVDLLESRPRPVDDDQPSPYPIQYSFDGEDFYAHVDLSTDGIEGARVILQWDESGEWRYHNTDLMPFPPGCRSVLEDVLVPPEPPQPASLATLSTAPYARNYDDLPEDDSDDDDYWNAYGSTDIGDSTYGSGAPVSAKDATSSEDAYWAQYASVHGTADSTIPSPIPHSRRKPPTAPSDAEQDMTSPVPLPVPVRVPSEDTYAEPLPIPPSLMARPRTNSRWDPASPTALAKLLASITPRESASASPAPGATFDMEEVLSSPTVGGSNDSELSSSPGLGLSGVNPSVAAAIIAEGESIARAHGVSPPLILDGAASHGLIDRVEVVSDDTDDDEADLRAALEGVWKMWRNKTMDGEGINKPTDFVVWKRLLEEQTALFEKTFSQNAELEARVEELERELSVWKEAFKTADGDRKVLNKTVLRLERSIGALKEDNPLILCLIDGDGNIFSSDLIKQGQAGGRQAAALLTKGLTDHLASIEPSESSVPSRGQVWLTIYCNKSGLVETLTSNGVCTVEEFEAFMLGFNQSSPLFSIVDVGNGKEAADSKIKECLRVFTRFPQTTKVFFGGAHDNGYTSTLNLLQNEGLLDKVTLLKGYKDLAHEINSLNLPQLEIEGIFITKKLYTNGSKKAAAAAAVANAKPVPVSSTASSPKSAASPKPGKQPVLQQVQQEVEKARSKAGTPTSNGKGSSSKKFRPLDPTQPLHKQKPPPCNFHYLARCNNGDHCRYEHNYPLTPEQVAELRTNAKKWPCPAINNGHNCTLGESCIMNHYCPKGPKCVFRKQGKCKFIGMQPVPQRKKAARKPKGAPAKKRPAPADEPAADGDESGEDRPAKVARVEGDGGEAAGLRRSTRNRGKALNYNEDGAGFAAASRALPRVVSASAVLAEKSAPRDAMKRVHDPKTYGAIPGIPVGTWWETRQACSVDAIHAPWVAGISSGPQGAYSVALSGGYEDDVDLGEGFTYTGSGGRNLKGTKEKPKNLRTAPQSCDQSFENPFNKALKRSFETKKPVRVIRGYKLDSAFAPDEGYRYDGLYTVESATMEKGLNKDGYLVCKFAFKRIPGQPRIPVKGEEASDSGEEDSADNEATDDTQVEDDAAADGDDKSVDDASNKLDADENEAKAVDSDDDDVTDVEF